MTNTERTFLKDFGTLTIIGLFGIVLGFLLIPANQTNADVLPVSVSISITNSICIGQTAHLTWSSVNATSVSIDQGIGPVSVSGDRYVLPTVTTTYTMTATNSSGGYGTASATVFVSGPCSTPTPTPTPSPTPTPTTLPVSVSISITNSICIGQTAHLTWSSVNATSVSIDQGIGPVSVSGDRYVLPTVTTTYTMTATNSSGGYGTASATVYVSGPCSTPTPTPTPTPSPTPSPTPTPTPTPISALTISKDVRNLSGANTSEFNNVNATPGDLVEFVIRVQNSGNVFANSIRVSDFFPSQLQYVSGSTTVDGVFFGDNITTSNIFLGSLDVNQAKVVKFRALVRDASVFSFGSTQLTNTARVTADNTGTVDDVAFVNVSRGEVLGTISLQIQKTGRNVTKGDLVEKTSMNATPNDTIEFLIRVKNLSSVTAYNVIVTDTLPTGMTYINNTTSLNNVITSNGVTGSGLNIGTLSMNQEAVVRFYASVNPGTTATLTNVSQARADNYFQAISNPVVITLGVVLGALSVATGASSTLYISLLAGLFSTLGFYWYKTRII